MNPLFDPGSLKGRIARHLVVPSLALLIVAGLTCGWLVLKQVRQVSDDALLFQLQSIAANVEQEPEELELEMPEGLMLRYQPGAQADYFELMDSAGQPAARSPSLNDTALDHGDAQGAVLEVGKHRFWSAPLPDQRPGRYVSARFLPTLDTLEEDDPPDDKTRRQYAALVAQPVLLTVAVSDLPYLALFRKIWLSIGASLLAVVLAMAWIIRRALIRGFGPMDNIAGQIEGLNAESLDLRITQPGGSSELKSVVTGINSLLARLDESFRRERQFSHDVAHELRTPLAELRNLAEVGARWPDDPKLTRQFFDDAIAASAQMDQTLTNLLSLARSDANLDQVETSGFVVNDLLMQAWARVCSASRADPSRLNRDVSELLQFQSGQQQWLLIFQNLLSNAVSHGTPGCEVRVSVTALADGTRCLEVANHCGDLDPDDVARVFDRMWRKDGARAADKHSGLGLPLVRAYATQLGLVVRASLADDGIFIVSITGIVATDHAAQSAKQGEVAANRFGPNPASA